MWGLDLSIKLNSILNTHYQCDTLISQDAYFVFIVNPIIITIILRFFSQRFNSRIFEQQHSYAIGHLNNEKEKFIILLENVFGLNAWKLCWIWRKDLVFYLRWFVYLRDYWNKFLRDIFQRLSALFGLLIIYNESKRLIASCTAHELLFRN